MDAVEVPLATGVVTTLMRSSGCGGGGGITRVELVGSQSERETCSSSFQPHKVLTHGPLQMTDNNGNINGSRSDFWNKMSDEDLSRHANKLSSLGNEETSMDHDMSSVTETKQLQRKSGKSSKSNGNCSRRSRVAHMEASMNATGSVDMNDLPKELGSYPGRCNMTEKMQTSKKKTSVSGKRSEKRSGKGPKTICDSFSVKAGLSSFSSAAGGSNIFGIYGSKQDIYDLTKHVEEPSLNELLDGSYKCPQLAKDKEKKTEPVTENILHSVREACLILQLQKPTQTQNVAAVDGTYNHNASSCAPNSGTSGTSKSDDNRGDTVAPSSCSKVEDSGSGLTDHANILEFPLFAPKDVLDRLALPPPKDLDLMLLDSLKPTSNSKVHSGGGLPSFPWSHISGGHFKTNPDVVKSTPSKGTCQGRWVKMGNSTAYSGDSTTYLVDLESLAYDQSLVPLGCQQQGSTEKENFPLRSIGDTTFELGVTPSGSNPSASKHPAEHSPGALVAAQTLCDIAVRFGKQDHNGTARCQKKPSQKSSIRATTLKSDEKLEKALFNIPSSRHVGPSNLSDKATVHTPKRLRLSVNEKNNDLINSPKRQLTWSTSTPQSSSPMNRSFTAPPTSAKLPNKPPKLRKLVPMEWKSRNDQKGNAKY